MNTQDLFIAKIGTAVKTANGTARIHSLLDDKMGVMKNGEKLPYVLLVGDDGEIRLHPEKAKQLIVKGECGALRILAEATEAGQETAPTSDEVTKNVNGPTKKSETIRICNEMWADGKVRKDIMVVLMDQLGLSKMGANTYYQNVKSGVWK